MPRIVSVSSGTLRYAQTISMGPHVLHSDEPADVGADDMGPPRKRLILASLGACANMTVQMYAERSSVSS
jgi:putative redox protein